MTLSFGKKVLQTTVYVKLVAPDELLLSEAVCRQLVIVNYHPSVKAIPRCTAEATSRLSNVESEEESNGTQSLTSPEETVSHTLGDKAVLNPEEKTTEREEQMEVKSKVS